MKTGKSKTKPRVPGARSTPTPGKAPRKATTPVASLPRIRTPLGKMRTSPAPGTDEEEDGQEPAGVPDSETGETRPPAQKEKAGSPVLPKIGKDKKKKASAFDHYPGDPDAQNPPETLAGELPSWWDDELPFRTSTSWGIRAADLAERLLADEIGGKWDEDSNTWELVMGPSLGLSLSDDPSNPPGWKFCRYTSLDAELQWMHGILALVGAPRVLVNRPQPEGIRYEPGEGSEYLDWAVSMKWAVDLLDAKENTLEYGDLAMFKPSDRHGSGSAAIVVGGNEDSVYVIQWRPPKSANDGLGHLTKRAISLARFEDSVITVARALRKQRES